ncbi:hypothetical protein [Nesterenkonia pannonica]|uniref:hypothetical protein n=1 Tax=Nesterenkonia pannonica TaxID=1548602 RepID=UPI0021644952|nr:hypothetical protein [Nesterenkonia pannonica]
MWCKADLPGPSGGSIYNARVLDAWRELGTDVEEAAVGGSWPAPDHGAERELARRLKQCRSALVDGIIASAAPDALAEAQAEGSKYRFWCTCPSRLKQD